MVTYPYLSEFNPEEIVLGAQRRWRKKLKRKLKKGIRKAVSSVTRAVKRLIRPIQKVVDFIKDTIESVLSMVRSLFDLIRGLPSALMSFPNPRRIATLTRDYVIGMLRLTRYIFVHAWGLVSGTVLLLVDWLVSSVPESAWRRVDNMFGRPTVWVPVCAGTTGVAPQLMPSVLRPLTANYSKGFNPFNMMSLLGHWHSFRFTTYTYRILVPWISGAVALVLVSPIWLAQMVINLPGLVINLMAHIANTIVLFGEDVLGEGGRLTLDYMVAVAAEIFKPFTETIRLIRNSF